MPRVLFFVSILYFNTKFLKIELWMAPSFKELTSNGGEDACCKAEQSRWKTEMEVLCCDGPREKDSL